MSSKAARRKRRLEAERQQLASVASSGIVHTRCSDVTLAELGVLLAQADELLGRIGAHAAQARTTWPPVPAAHELRATIEEIAAATASSRTKLAAAFERSRRFQQSSVHVHLCGDLAVRMVPLAVLAPEPASPVPDVDEEPAYTGDDFGPADDLPF